MNKKTATTCIKGLVSAFLVGIILWKIGPEKLVQAFLDINQNFFWGALLLSVIVAILGALKWQIMVKGSGHQLSLKTSTISFLGAMGIGLLTPARAGELSRVLFISGNHSLLLGVALADKAIDLLSLLFLAFIGCILAQWMMPAQISLICFLATFVIIFFPSYYSKYIQFIINYLPFKDKLKLVLSGFENLPKATLAQALTIRMIVCLIDILQFSLLLNSIMFVDLKSVFASYPIIVLINTFPATISGIGLREAAAVMALGIFNVPGNVAVTASFLLFCINTLLPGIVGIVLLNRFELKWKNAVNH